MTHDKPGLWQRFSGLWRGRPQARLIEDVDGRLVDEDEYRVVYPGALSTTVRGQVIPAMQAAVNLLSHSISTLPRYVVDARMRPIQDHPVTRLMNVYARRWPASALWEFLYRSALQFGIGYAWIVRQGGVPVRLLACDPTMSNYRVSDDRRSIIFNLWPLVGRQRIEVSASDTLVVVGDGYNGLQGLSPISAYAVTMGVLGHANRHLLSTLTQGMHISGVVDSEPEVGQGMGWDLARISELRRKLVELFAGTTKAGGVPVLPPGFKFTAIPYNAVDIELVRLLELSIEDICRIYRVPPRLIYHYRQGIRYSQDAEASNTEFGQYSIRPRADYLGDMVASQLLSLPSLNDDRLRIMFDSQGLFAGTITQRIAAMDRGVARTGNITINESREYISTGRLPYLEPVDDGDRLLDPKGAPPQPRDGNEGTDGGEEPEDNEDKD